MDKIKSTARFFLKEVYEKKKMKNNKYSLRAFARDLRIPSGRISELLSGKRTFTITIAQGIAAALNLNKSEQKIFFSLVRHEGKPKKKCQPMQEIISTQDLKKISHWRYFALLCLIETESEYDLMVFSKKLQIDVDKVDTMIKELLQLGIVEVLDQKIRVLNTQLITEQDKTNYDIQKFHKDLVFFHMLQMEKYQPLEREYQSLILTVDPKDLNRIKKYLRRFVSDFQKKFIKDKNSRVYGLSLQLTPLTIE